MVVAAGQRSDDLVRSYSPRRPLDLLVGRVRPAIGDVVSNCAGEKEALLRHIPELAPIGTGSDGTQVHAVGAHRPLVGVVKARYQLHDRGLPSACLTYQCDRFPRSHVKGDTPYGLGSLRPPSPSAAGAGGVGRIQGCRLPK